MPSVGDEMLLVEGSHWAKARRTYPARVSKVGRKYFYAETLDPTLNWACRGLKFHIDTGWESGDGNYPARMTTQEVLDEEKRRAELQVSLRAAGITMDYATSQRLTTDQLEQILAIVEPAETST